MKGYHLVICVMGLTMGTIIVGMALGAVMTCTRSGITPGCVVFATTSAGFAVGTGVLAVTIYWHVKKLPLTGTTTATTTPTARL